MLRAVWLINQSDIFASFHLSLAFNAILLLIAAGPVLMLAGGSIANSSQMLLAAIGLLTVAAGASAADIRHLKRTTSGLWPVVAFIPVLIVVQLLPLPFSLSHSIWQSTAEALPAVLFGRITVDVGETLSALFSVLSAISIMVATIAVARERRRAELILFAASVISSLLSVAATLEKAKLVAAHPSDQIAANLGGIGIILNIAVIVLAFERRETRRESGSQFVPIALGGVLGLALSSIALFDPELGPGVMAPAFGLVLIVLILLIRRLDLAGWTAVALGVATLTGTAIVIAWWFDRGAGAAGLQRFVSAQPAETIAAIDRMLSDSRWLGSGAATFETIARIYQGADGAALHEASTTAIELAIELGTIGLVGSVLIGIVLLVKLFRGALMRGRDSFFPMAAAAAVAFAMCEAFTSAGLLQPACATVMAIVIGLGLSQCISQNASH